MKLVLKTMSFAGGRSMYLYFPEGEPRTAYKRSLITVLRDDSTETSVLELLNDGGLSKLTEENEIILAFPNPVNCEWNYTLDKFKADDMAFIKHIQGEFSSESESAAQPRGTGDAKSMMKLMLQNMKNSWHPMNDTRYIAGIGTGASMAITAAALEPALAAGIFADGGELSPEALKAATFAPMPAFLVDCSERVSAYFMKSNGAMEDGVQSGLSRFANDVNKNQIMLVSGRKIPRGIEKAYCELFSIVRRPNTGKYGDIERRLVPKRDYKNFEFHIDEDILGDEIHHTWFTVVPDKVRKNSAEKVPLLVFFHGASDNPAEAADMSKFHEIGEKDGFITVYPWATNKLNWNSDMYEDGADDDNFSVLLIDYMIKNYPVDEGRVYLSGFSNGAAQAQTVAICHPDKIAAVCPIDSNWPGSRSGESEISYKDVNAMRIAMEIKEKSGIDYRMPNWYTYGNREPSYPVFNKSTQQHQYDFWKMYNNVTIKETPPISAPHPSGCGVLGDRYERLRPSACHPHHIYDVQRFNTNDEGAPNLYNYVVMLDKGHDVAQMDPELGWNFVKKFRREKNGSVSEIK